jgi:hypothetical protein
VPHLIHCYAYAWTFMLWSTRNKSICCASRFLPIAVLFQNLQDSQAIQPGYSHPHACNKPKEPRINDYLFS